ncbi:MAG: AbrB/MazE/SpoVT family DNA-binding domain-containing protein [Oscillospiraceae bacterium]|nr:AbrB/MazE/SpoVT family DNA-binding domain-containing protein [Oscillospiraceae bacterium]MBQ4544650.1 AbrB/MazE/SpoVT family DNA-binding domain-containing protein [Oscillospiraceae bacterium]MBQ6902252.1 AbrB/MazE/SpoVT family DNA-binding domain-containing protein [Oscillospiraceae bacterium]
MKSTGIIRKIDELGRIVLPIELRKKMDIAQRDPIEIYVDGDMIILKKYESECIFCGSRKSLLEYKDKHVCEACIKNMTK